MSYVGQIIGRIGQFWSYEGQIGRVGQLMGPDSTAKQICGYQNSLLEVLELLIPGDNQHYKKFKRTGD